MSRLATSRIAAMTTTILSVAFGRPIHLDQGKHLHHRSDICRFQVLDAPPGMPSRVVVKVIPGLDDNAIVSSERVRLNALFYSEWAGLTLLQDINPDPPLAPRIYGGDPATGILVMEDLGLSLTLWEQLQGQDPEGAITQLVALAKTLGRMHAKTMGQQPRFAQICNALRFVQPQTNAEHDDWMQPTLEAIATTLAIPLLPVVMEDLIRLRHCLNEPGIFWAYTQGDPSPGNCLFIAPHMRLLDFGVGAYRHACVDFPPPWCWQRIPSLVMSKMIDTYQIELSRGCSGAADPLYFAQGLVEGCAYWSMTLLKDWSFTEVVTNAHMRRNLLDVLGSFVELSQQTAYLEALGSTLATVVEAIGRRWPSDTSLPVSYPVFQRR